MTLMLIGAVQAFFLIVLLLTKRGRSPSDTTLMAWLGCMGLQLLFYYDNFSATPIVQFVWGSLGFSLSLLSAPLMFLYIHQLTHDQRLPRRWWLHLLPYLIYNSILFYCYFGQSWLVVVERGFIGISSESPRWLRINLGYPLAISGALYAGWSLWLLRQYQLRLPDLFSYTERIQLNWLKWLVLASLSFFVCVYLLVEFSGSESWIRPQNIFVVVAGAMTVYIFFVGFMGFRQTTIFSGLTSPPVATSNIPEPELKKQAYAKSGLDESERKIILRKLKKHMEEQQPWLEDGLTLAQLAAQMECTPNQLSQVINQETGRNFFGFINGYRLDAVCQKLQDPQSDTYTILALAFDCGFRSKASFNKLFKAHTGLTPSQYRKKRQK